MTTNRTASDKINATAVAFGKVRDGRQAVLFEGAGLPEGRVCLLMEIGRAKQLRRGQRVRLVPTQDRDSWDIEE